MFIRHTSRVVNGKQYDNYSLVESYRTPKGPRQRTICSLGSLAPAPPERWLELAKKIEHALEPQAELFDDSRGNDPEVAAIVEKIYDKKGRDIRRRRPRLSRTGAPAWYPAETHEAGDDVAPAGGSDDVVEVRVGRVTMEHARAAGHVHVGHEFWQRLEMDSALGKAGLNKRACNVACAMVLNRLVAPKSEHAMPAWIKSNALADILEDNFESLDDDTLYRMLDRLYPRRAFIEAAIVERERTLFNLDPTIYLYDLTSHYFEGLANEDPRAKRGYSRDRGPRS